MARDVNTIVTSLNTEQAAQPQLTTLNSTSQTAIYTLWKYITAVVQNLLEQLWDIKKTEYETIIDTAAVGSDLWIQKKVLEFQYDAAIPQIVQLNTTTMSVAYNPIDTTKRIITRASVKTNGVRTVDVKVAKSDPPVALTAPELAALKNYLTQGGDSTYAGRGVGICFAGVQIKATSLAADRLYLKMTVFYNGQYAPVIEANVKAAVNTYLANIPFDGQLKLISLMDAIQAVEGVTDVVFYNVGLRANTVTIAYTTLLVSAQLEVYSTYPLIAGYAVEEDTVGYTFTDTITFTAV